MGGYLSTPISVKKYIKIKPRKLISGFLHINVVNHSDNDDASETGKFVDAYEYYRGKLAAGTLDADQHSADPWRAQAISNFADVSRSNKFLNFGDYDCLLFWVAGGMTLQDPIMGTLKTQYDLSAQSYSDTTANAWYTSIDDYCQNFIKYDLISRINCGYGHGALMGDEKYKGTVPITKNEFRADQAGISGHDCTVTPPAYGTTGGVSPNVHGGNFQKHIMSCGSFVDSTSTDGTTSYPNGEDLNTANKNTYFPPVENVQIYGQHHIKKVQQTNGSTPLYSISPDVNGYHSKDFWNLVIEVKIRGFDDGWTTGNTQADKEFFRSRTNIFFQPFGETASFNISDTPHTS